MKKNINIKNSIKLWVVSSLLVLSFIFNYSDLNAAEGELELGFTIGATIPSDKLSSFYEQNSLKLNTIEYNKLSKNILSTGYNVGIKLNLPLSNDFELFGSVLVNRLPENEIVVKDNNDPDKIFATLTEFNNLIPLEVGFNLNLLNGSFAKIYSVANLSYNLLYQSIDIKSSDGQDVPLPTGFEETKLNSRIGGGLGVGAKFDIKLVKLAIEAKFNRSNLIFKSNNEFNRDYYTFNFFVFF